MFQFNSQKTGFSTAKQGCRTSKKKRFYQSALALGLMAGLMGACAENAAQRETSDGSTNVQTEEVAENTEGYIGQVVTIRSEPLEKIGDSTFTVSDKRFLSNEPILVINTSGAPMVLPEESGVEVQVTGEVRNFVMADVAREFNLTLAPDTYQDYENQPVILAQSIALAPEPGEIAANPEQYYGRTLAVTGAIEDVQSNNTFTLNEDRLLGAEDLLIVYASPRTGTQPPAAPLPTITAGDQVAVTGVLRSFGVTEFERDYNLTWDLEVQRQLEADYSDRPVLVATDVYPSAIPE